MNEQTQNNRRRSRFLKILFKVEKVNPYSNSENTIWIVDPLTQVTSAKHMAKFKTKSNSNQGTFCNFSLALKRKINKTAIKHLKIHKFPFKNVIVLAIECKMYLKIQQKLC